MAAFTPSVIAVIDGRPIKALAAEQLQGLRVLSGAEVVVADDGERALSGADLSSIAIVGGAGRRLQRIERSGSYDGELRLTHDVATDNLGRRYVFSTSNPRVQTVARGKWARRSAPRGSP
ncbi:hypothetical protein [uncultured Phenylobacterium sp.]|uniref:hypothetical protein n=1 Tax=uncultured Phenylobacterium sp. TaxID=349273 RepID=UPI0025FECC10|nr:hypothetical protein [uncultured Phenylobacterium sp.]